jgi:hypothetical protein
MSLGNFLTAHRFDSSFVNCADITGSITLATGQFLKILRSFQVPFFTQDLKALDHGHLHKEYAPAHAG